MLPTVRATEWTDIDASIHLYLGCLPAYAVSGQALLRSGGLVHIP